MHLSHLRWRYARENFLHFAVPALSTEYQSTAISFPSLYVHMRYACITFFTFPSCTFWSFSALEANRSSCFTVNYKINPKITNTAFSACNSTLLHDATIKLKSEWHCKNNKNRHFHSVVSSKYIKIFKLHYILVKWVSEWVSEWVCEWMAVAICCVG